MNMPFSMPTQSISRTALNNALALSSILPILDEITAAFTKPRVTDIAPAERDAFLIAMQVAASARAVIESEDPSRVLIALIATGNDPMYTVRMLEALDAFSNDASTILGASPSVNVVIERQKAEHERVEAHRSKEKSDEIKKAADELGVNLSENAA